MAEVALQALAGIVGQRDEGLAVVAAVLADVAADLIVAARVVVLVAQAAKDLHGGVPLLGRGVFIRGQDAVDDGVERAEHGAPAAACCACSGVGWGWARISRTLRREW